jgi:hypothetical protein
MNILFIENIFLWVIQIILYTQINLNASIFSTKLDLKFIRFLVKYFNICT